MFILARVIPGDPCRRRPRRTGDRRACDEFADREGLDQPIIVQFVKYLGNLLTVTSGSRSAQRRSVAEILIERLPTTIELSIVALTFAIVVGVPLGVIAAYRRNTAADVGTMVVANAGVSMPVFVLGLLLQYLFAVTLKDTFFALPPGPSLARARADAVLRAVGAERQRGARVHLQLRDPQRAAAVELAARRRRQPAPDPSGDRRRHDPAGDHRQDDPVEPARRARPRLRPHRPGQGLRRARSSAATPCAAPCCRWSPSSGCRSAVCSAARSSPSRSSRSPASARRCATRSRARDYGVVQGFALIVGISFVIVNLITDMLYTVFDPRVRVS